MNLAELLKNNGIADDVIEKITAGMKENKIYTAGEENLDIRYGKLKTDFDNLTAQHNEANTLIEQLKAGAKGNESLQAKINTYETQTIPQLKAQLEEAQIEADAKVALLSAKTTDIDYMMFKLKEKGKLERGEDGHIKGLDDMIAGLKVQFPNQFERANSGNQIDPNVLPDRNTTTGVSVEEFSKMGYQNRLKLKQEQPEVYAQLTGKSNE